MCPAMSSYRFLYYTLHYPHISALHRNALCASNKKTVVEWHQTLHCKYSCTALFWFLKEARLIIALCWSATISSSAIYHSSSPSLSMVLKMPNSHKNNGRQINPSLCPSSKIKKMLDYFFQACKETAKCPAHVCVVPSKLQYYCIGKQAEI